MAGSHESANFVAGSLRRVWRNAGVPVDGVAGTLASIAEKGDLLIDSTNATLYQNTNTQASPTWTQKAASGAAIGIVGDMAAAGTGVANVVGVGLTTAAIDHVHALGAHAHSGATTGGALGDHDAGAITLTNAVMPAATAVYIGRDNAGDLNLNALVGKQIELRVAGTDVITIAGATVTVAQALTVSIGGLTVSAGGAAITGNSTITGDLNVTGSLTFGGAWTVAETLTVDELILDTDGVAPAGTNCYAVRDNGGDLTINAITGKQVIVAVNNTDEYAFSATILDMNANALDNCGFLILNAATAPAAGEVYLVNDNTGDLTLNALDTKAIHLAVNGVDEFNFTGTALEVVSGNVLKFLGNNGIQDSNGNEVIYVEAVAGATTYLNVKGGNAVAVQLECLGADDLGFIIQNNQDEEILILTPVATAVNELTVLNAATGARPVIRVTGEADIGLEVQNLAGEIQFATLSTNAPVNWLVVSNANTGARPFLVNPGEDDVGMEFRAKNNEEMLILATVAVAVNEITITAAAATGNPSVAASGGDANIHLALAGKGTGGVTVSDDVLYGSVAAHTPDTANGSLYLQSTAHATKGFVCIKNADLGLVVGSDGSVDRDGTVGTNAIHVFNGTAPVGLLANGISIYSNAGEGYIMDAAGNAALQTQHSADGDVIEYAYSAKKNKTVVLHLEKMLRKLQEKFPIDFAGLIVENPGFIHKGERVAKGLGAI